MLTIGLLLPACFDGAVPPLPWELPRGCVSKGSAGVDGAPRKTSSPTASGSERASATGHLGARPGGQLHASPLWFCF